MTRLLLVLSLCCITFGAQAQLRNNPFPGSQDRAEIPFSYINNFIIVEVVFNNILPLRFILDTGAENTIITRREITDMLQVNYTKTFTVLGADMETELIAYLANGVDFRLGRDVNIRKQNVLVLDEDYFRFEEYAGISVHGIIGADMLRYFVVEFDYKRKVITLHNPNSFKTLPKAYDQQVTSFRRYKPYVHLPVRVNPGDTLLELKLLVDTGASLAMLLHANTDSSLTVPAQVIPTTIGMGLGGFLSGFVGRIEEVDIGNYDLDGVIAYYLDVNPNIDSAYLNQRNGVMGNRVWERFSMVIDYPHEKMYLRPQRHFKRKFVYDRSGLVLLASGDNLRRFVVMTVVPGSPAEELGIQRDDVLKSINRLPIGFLDLGEINRRLRGREGKKLRLSFERGEEKYKVRLQLREYL